MTTCSEVFGEAVHRWRTAEMLRIALWRTGSSTVGASQDWYSSLGKARGTVRVWMFFEHYSCSLKFYFHEFVWDLDFWRHSFIFKILTLSQLGFLVVMNKNKIWLTKIRKQCIWNILEIAPRRFWKVGGPGSKPGRTAGIKNSYLSPHHRHSLVEESPLG